MSQITKLPDGSAFFTATVLSKEEAMSLPVDQRPLCFRLSSEIYHAIWEMIGYASTCHTRAKSEAEETEMASQCAVELCFKIAKELEKT